MSKNIPDEAEKFLKAKFPDEWIDRRYPINTSKLDWEDIFEVTSEYATLQCAEKKKEIAQSLIGLLKVFSKQLKIKCMHQSKRFTHSDFFIDISEPDTSGRVEISFGKLEQKTGSCMFDIEYLEQLEGWVQEQLAIIGKMAKKKK